MLYGKIPASKQSVADYHACEAFSSTKAKVFASSPLLYFRKFVSKAMPKEEDTQEFLIGHSSHTLLLEGEKTYSDRYYVVPEGVGKQKADHKAIRAKLAAEHTGKIELSFEDDVLNRRMVAAVLAHPEAARLLEGGEAEVTWRMKGKHHDVQARTDKFNVNGWPADGWPFICDFKSTASLKDDNPKSFRRTFWSYNYHLSAHLYREVVSSILGIKSGDPRPRFYWIAAEKEEPFGVEVFEIDDAAYEIAGRQLADILKRLNIAYETGIWPGSPSEIQILSAPAWLEKKVAEDTEPNLY